jgi:Dolichyl-phosphate-mannose-protein mannosyltransferase
MRTAEEPRAGLRQPRAAPAPDAAAPSAGGRRWAWCALAIVLAGGLALRLWGVRQGLPFAYNTDEDQHFVPHAVRMLAEGTLNPHYFANPPAFTYLLRAVYGIWYGGGTGVARALAHDPSAVYTLARVAAAALGTLAVWLLYLVGARLFGRGVGVLAAAVEAVAFLPVFYAHVALNDVPTLAPVTLSLLGTVGVLRSGRLRDHALAGVGLGLACATKYTAGIALLPLLAALVVRARERGEGGWRRALAGVALAAACALASFLLANPYALLDYSSFHAELAHQSSLSAEAQGKLGAPQDGGIVYYLWVLGWGLGWVPAAAALGGALAVFRADRRLGWVLVPAPVAFIVLMGLEGRYFGRWLLPIFPILCLLAAFFAARVIDLAARVPADRRARARGRRQGARQDAEPAGRAAWAPSLPRVLVAIPVVAALLAQGLIYSVHAGRVLSQPDTRNITRAWMLAHIPAGASIVVEPVAPDSWAAASPGAAACPGKRWCKYPSEFSRIAPDGSLRAGRPRFVGVENYERTLSPALLGYYVRNGYCWVVSGSTQAGRAWADPGAVPGAIAYYRALARRGQVVFSASPYAHGRSVPRFNFDWSFDYYPLAYERPGPQMTVYRLRGGGCG